MYHYFCYPIMFLIPKGVRVTIMCNAVLTHCSKRAHAAAGAGGRTIPHRHSRPNHQPLHPPHFHTSPTAEFKWPFWAHWAHVAGEPRDAPQRLFVEMSLDTLVRLSYRERVQKDLPEALWPLLPCAPVFADPFAPPPPATQQVTPSACTVACSGSVLKSLLYCHVALMWLHDKCAAELFEFVVVLPIGTGVMA
jgi:hypothetical protein